MNLLGLRSVYSCNGISPCPFNSGIKDEINHDRAEAHSTPDLRYAFFIAKVFLRRFSLPIQEISKLLS